MITSRSSSSSKLASSSSSFINVAIFRDSRYFFDRFFRFESRFSRKRSCAEIVPSGASGVTSSRASSSDASGERGTSSSDASGERGTSSSCVSNVFVTFGESDTSDASQSNPKRNV